MIIVILVEKFVTDADIHVPTRHIYTWYDS